ncbi:MAG: ATP-binding cassette domain-containing protein [Planctomycetes bacterium]|nr:ATP-binding cassette domain-containing protein [Planctomycetota bacterium]
MSSAGPVFELRAVAKKFGPTRAVHRIDLAIPPGRSTLLIGPSGCGKSTLLRLMIGLIKPDAGDVRFEGAAITPQNVLTLRRRMGYVIQDGGLFPHLTARGNVTLMARYLGQREHDVQARLDELVELTRFPPDALERYPAQLSGGQRQRVSLMRALMLDPQALLLDEPLAALDPMIRSELQTDLRRIFQTLKKTVVMVTHDMGEAAYFGDVIVLMRAGSVVQRGALEDLIDSPADPFVSKFINAQRGSAAWLRETAR